MGWVIILLTLVAILSSFCRDRGDSSGYRLILLSKKTQI